MTEKMDAKNDSFGMTKIQKSYKQIPCTTKVLNENNLLTFDKSQLIQFILHNKEKLLVDEQKHRKDYVKKPKRQFDFDK